MAKKNKHLTESRNQGSRPAGISALTRYLMIHALFYLLGTLWAMFDVAIGNYLGPELKVTAVLGVPVLFFALLLCIHAMAFNGLHKWAYPIARFLLSRQPKLIKDVFGVSGLIDKPDVRLAFGYAPVAQDVVYDDYGYARYAHPPSTSSVASGAEIGFKREIDPLGMALLTLGIIAFFLSFPIPPIPIGLGISMAALGGLLIWTSK